MMTNFTELTTTVQHLQALAPEAFMLIENDNDLERVTAFLKSLDRTMGETPGHPLSALADSVMQRIMAYEEEHYPIPDSTAAEMIAFLMEQQGVAQKDVVKGTGITQPVLSRLISGERVPTTKHIPKLAAFFKVTPATFLPS